MSSMLANVRRGKIIRPVLILIYGPGGIGKSTWGSKAPNPIFLGAEEGTDHIDVARLPTPKNLEDVHQAIRELLEEPHDYKSLVVDSLDWIEPLVYNAICRRYGKPTIETAAGGYGKGYLEAADEWVKLLGLFNQLRDKRGMNIILLAHPEAKSTPNPLTQSTYMKFRLKLHDRSKDKVMEAVDAIFFANFEMYPSKVGEEVKVMVSKNRVLQGVPNQYDGYDAKNRYGLTDPVPMSLPWEKFIELCNLLPALEEVQREIGELIKSIPTEDLLAKAKETVGKAGDNVQQLIIIRDRLKLAITKN